MNILDQLLKPYLRIQDNKLVRVPLPNPLKPTAYGPPPPVIEESPPKLPRFKKPKTKKTKITRE